MRLALQEEMHIFLMTSRSSSPHVRSVIGKRVTIRTSEGNLHVKKYLKDPLWVSVLLDLIIRLAYFSLLITCSEPDRSVLID